MAKEARSQGIKITERDLLILRGLFDCRILNIHHFAELFFEGRQDAARKRIKKLQANKLLNVRQKKVTEEHLYFITRKGFELLTENGALDDYPKVLWKDFEKRAVVSSTRVQHEVEIADVIALFARAVRGHARMKIKQFVVIPLFTEFQAVTPAGRKSYRPDAYIQLSIEGEEDAYIFVEVDRSNHSHSVIMEKCSAYWDYYKRGGFAKKSGGQEEGIHEFPFRVLWVVPSIDRRNLLMESLIRESEKPQSVSKGLYSRRQAWFAAKGDLENDILGEYWLVPEDYKKALKGTNFDPLTRSRDGIKKRNIERDKFVDERVLKRKLFS